MTIRQRGIGNVRTTSNAIALRDERRGILILALLLSLVATTSPALVTALKNLHLPTLRHSSAARTPAASPHAFHRVDANTFSLANKAAGVTGFVDRTGLTVSTSPTAPAVGIRSTAIGRPHTMTALAPAAPVTTDDTAALRHGGVVEWFHNRAGYVEQGWTIATRPAGTGPLALELSITGATVATSGRHALSFLPATGPSIGYGNLVVRDAHGKSVPAHFARTASGARIVIDDAQATYPVVIDPDLSVAQTIGSPPTSAGNSFGSDVAVSARWMAVKEPGAKVDPTSSARPGRIDIYHDSTGTGSWQLVARMCNCSDSTVTTSNTGIAIVVEPQGVTVLSVVSTAGVPGVQVWTFTGDPESTALTAPPVLRQTVTMVTPSGTFLSTLATIAADGGLFVAGMPNASASGVRAFAPDGSVTAPSEQIGTAEIFRRSGGFATNYAFEARIDPPGGITQPPAQRDIAQLFGSSLSINASSGLVVVGAPGDDGVQTHTGGTIAAPAPLGTSTFEGAVDIFRNTGGTTWSQVSRNASTTTVPGALFGTSVGLASNGSVVVGAPGEAVGGTASVGAGYLFDKAVGSDSWSQKQRLLPDDPTTATNEAVGGSAMGTKAAIDPSAGDIYFSAPNQNISTGRTGAVYAYARAADGSTTFSARLLPQTASDQHGGRTSGYGSSLAVTDSAVAVGASAFGNADETFAGEVVTFRRNGTSYPLAVELSPQSGVFPDHFGSTVAQDGDVLAVSEPNSQRGSNFGLGAVAVYDRAGNGTWVFEQMLFPYSNVQTNDTGTWGNAIALHVRRDTQGNDIGLVLAVGDPTDSRFDPDGNSPGAASTISNGGSVALFGRDGPPGTTWGNGYKIWAGGRSNSTPLSDLSDVTVNGKFGSSLAFTADGTLVVSEPGDNAGAGAIDRFDTGSTSFLNYLYLQKIAVAGTSDFGHAVRADGTQVLVLPGDGSGIHRYTDGNAATNLVDAGTFPMNLQGLPADPMGLSLAGNRFAVSGADPSAGDSRVVRVYRVVGNIAVREAQIGAEPAATTFAESIDLNHSGGAAPTLVVGSSDANTSIYVAKVKGDGSAQWSRSGALVTPVFLGYVGSGSGVRVANWPTHGGAAVGYPLGNLGGSNAGGVAIFDDSAVTPPVGPQAFVDVSLPSTVQVGATHLQTGDLKPGLLTQSGDLDGSVAATPIGSIDLSQAPDGTTVNASPLHSIPLASIPLASIPLASIPLASIPLHSIAGGWDAVLAGSPYANIPLQDVLLSDVYNLPSVQALPLGALSLAGSPLASIPLASIALGATPLHSIPLDGSGADPIVQWCNALTAAGADTNALELDCAHPSAAVNQSATMLSIGVRGAPLHSIPLHSIPLASIDLSGAPLASIPLHSIGVAGTPLHSIPLHSIDVAGTPLHSIPLHSIPLHSIPLHSIPLASIQLSGTPLHSIPLASIDIADTPLHSIPLASIDLSGVPLHSIPLASIPLHSIPLHSIPLASIPLHSIPLASIPLASIDVADTPLHSIPLHSIPLASIPLASIPLASIPLHSIPLHSIPLHSITINGSPLASIPLHSIDLAGTPLHSIPLHSIGAAELAAVVDCTLVDCGTATLGDAAAAGALRDAATLGTIEDLLGGVRLSDLIGSGNAITAGQLRAALGTLTMQDMTGFDDLTLGELPELFPYLQLGNVAGLVPGLRLGDIADALQEFSADDVRAALENSHLTLADITGWDDVTLGEVDAVANQLHFGDLTPALSGFRLADLVGVIQKPGGGTYSSDDLRAALESVLGANATLGDLNGFDDLTLGELGEYGDASLGDLLGALTGGAADGITLADLLLALVNPKQYPWQALDMSSVATQALDEDATRTSIHVAYRADAPDGLPRTVRVSVQLPAHSRYAPNSTSGTFGTPAEWTPTIDGDTLTWTIDDVPANAVQNLIFDMQAPINIGSTQVKASAFLPADDALASDTAQTTVVERLEPNDTLATATPLADDTIVLSHVSTSGDIDVYKFDVTQPGTRVSLSLSNLDADLDIALYAPRAGTIVATGNRSIDPIEDDGGSGLPGAQQSGSVGQQSAGGNDVAAPTDLGSLATVQGSFNRGHADDQIDTGVLSQTGTYYVAVTGYNGATDIQPYALRLKRFTTDTQPACPARSVDAGLFGTSLPSQLPVGTTTAFLVNQSRMVGLYGADATNALMTKLSDFVSWLNNQNSLGQHAIILTVDADSGVRSAYARWDASPCLPSGANGVVSEIARVLNGYRAQGAALKNVVVVGGDDTIPFARVPDATKVANESGYSSTFADLGGNALYATFATSSVQTDNAYVDPQPYAFGDRTLAIPDTAIGRLVESPNEIGDQLDDFRAAGGKLAVGMGLVTGYDFLSDGAHAVQGQVARTYGTVDGHLISDTWTRQDLENAISTLKPNLLSINAHFDHYRALPGAGNTTGDESDLFTAASVRGSLNGDLAGAVVFSMGCHSGLSASDKLVSGDRALDIAQAVSDQGGVFVGNTGFGYGDTDTVALSESLMADFAQRLDGSMTVGDALLYAKNAYFSSLAEFTPYDEKVLNETTFYGLPFYRLDVPNPPSVPMPGSPVISRDTVTGIDSVPTHVAPTYQTRTADDGTTYVAAIDPLTGEDSLTTVQGRPVEPKVDTEYALPAGRTSHDSLVLGLTSVDAPDTRPYVFQPVVDGSGEQVDVGTDTAFPTRPVRVNEGLTPAGGTYHVAATTGYFRTTADDGTGVQRTYKSMDVLTYLPPSGSTDFTAPTFSRVTAQVHDGMLSISAHATDDHGGFGAVTRVRALVLEDPRAGVATTWRGLDLVRTTGTDEWTGSLSTSGRRLEFILQAVDAVGNVGVTTDKAENYTDDATVGSTGGSGGGGGPVADLALSLSGPQGGDNWYTGPVQVTATGGTQVVYEVVGESDPAGYQAPFTVSGTGIHTVRVTSADGQEEDVAIRIDDVGPVAHLISPASGQLVPASGFPVSYECTDAGSGPTTCTATVDGVAAANGAIVHPSAGTHTIVVTAGKDRAGNNPSVPTVTQTVTVVGPPTVGAVGVAKVKDGTPTTLTVPFTGTASLTYSATITWGDGGVTNCDMSGAGCTITRNGSGGGTLTVSHTYATNAAQLTATVAMRDQLGQTGTGTVLLNRTTSLSATPALLKLRITTNVIELASGSISARLTNSAGQPLAGEKLTFSLPSGSVICTGTTDANGNAACPTTIIYTLAMILAGRYVVTYSGHDVYRGSTTTASLIG
jgi:hypothetical protein